jgi:hypothetical protein
MRKTDTILNRQIMGPNGWESVGSIIAQMQADGTPQRIIDRWLQGLTLSREFVPHTPERL